MLLGRCPPDTRPYAFRGDRRLMILASHQRLRVLRSRKQAPDVEGAEQVAHRTEVGHPACWTWPPRRSRLEPWPSRQRGFPVTRKQGIPKSGTWMRSGIGHCKAVIGCSSHAREAPASVGWRCFRRGSRFQRRGGSTSSWTMVRLKLEHTSSWPLSTTRSDGSPSKLPQSRRSGSSDDTPCSGRCRSVAATHHSRSGI